MGGHPRRQLRLRLGRGVVEGGGLLGDAAKSLGVGIRGRGPEVPRGVGLGVHALAVRVDAVIDGWVIQRLYERTTPRLISLAVVTGTGEAAKSYSPARSITSYASWRLRSVILV